MDFFGHIDIPRFLDGFGDCFALSGGDGSIFGHIRGTVRIGRNPCSYQHLTPTPLRFRPHEVDVNISLSNLNDLSSLGIQFSVLGFQ